MGCNYNTHDDVEEQGKVPPEKGVGRVHRRCKGICFIKAIGPITEYHDATYR